MKTYQEIKNILKENREKIIFTVSAIMIFFVGFGVGESRNSKHSLVPSQSKYTTKSAKEQPKTEIIAENKTAETKTAEAATETKAETTVNPPKVAGESILVPATAEAQTPVTCPVKGNISSGGRKLYHIPGGSFYKRVKAEQCFKTEEEAKAAGFQKSSR